nr:C39 family peptidase [Candidatus Levybacteria bacterium]
MKNLTALKIFFFVFFLLSFSFIFPTWNKINASDVIFQDNFDDDPTGSFPNKWEILPFPNLCPDEWRVDSGVLKISITNFNSCSTNIVPKSSEWPISIKNYVFEADMTLISGTDHNIVYRTDPLVGLGYELHFQSPTNLVASFPGNYFNIPGDYSLGKLYHVKIVVHDNNIQIFINGNLIKDFTSITEAPAGKIALRASVGGDPSSETYFDNIVVTSLDATPTPLTVPYFNQNDSTWGSTEYDHSISLGFSNPTMDRWGCAVTSAAMVLNYHNIKKMPDGASLDPGSLNIWLKNNNGYAIGYKNMDGWYSYLKFPSISTLTKKIFEAGRSNIKLEYKRTKIDLTQTLDNDLNIGKFPDILKVSNSQTSSHFVVAKGISGNTYSINDPEWNYATLSSFNNTFSQLDRFVPSNTNLSYLLAVVNPSVEMMITAPNSKKTGKNLSNNEELNDIDNASYSLQLPISNPNDTDQNENLGTNINEFLLPTPTDGTYEIKLSSNRDGFYEINLAAFKKNGDNDSNYIRGIITKNNDETLIINYSQTEGSRISKTFEDLINDLSELKKLNQFKNDGIYNSLLVKVTIAQLSSSISKKISTNILNAMLNEVKAQRGKGITEDGYQVLYYDINYLINNNL